MAVLVYEAMSEIPLRTAGVPPASSVAATKCVPPALSVPTTVGAPSSPEYLHSRGYLPHFDAPGKIQNITVRLYDSVPVHVIVQWQRELSWTTGLPAKHPVSVELRRRLARYQDQGFGACSLANPEVASVVEGALLYFDPDRYRLLAWCIMPNHVHVLVETLPCWSLASIVHSWKSFAAKVAKRIIGGDGQFWFPDYFDRYVRDEDHFRTTVEYIENNPVKAGLCRSSGDWRFSSASVARMAG